MSPSELNAETPGDGASSGYAAFRDKVRSMEIVDSHEHIPTEEVAVGIRWDFFDLLSAYVSDDLITAGMDPAHRLRMLDKSYSFDERWSYFEPMIPLIRHTTFFTAIYHVLTDIYGLNELTKDEVRRVSRAITDAVKPGFYRKAFERIGVRAVLPYVSYDDIPRYTDAGMLAVPTVSDMVPHSRADLHRLEKHASRRVRNLRDLMEIVDTFFAEYLEHGVRNIKFSTAYRRSLEFRRVRRQEAEDSLDRLLSLPERGELRVLGRPGPTLESAVLRELEDFLTHYMIQIAEREGLTVVFHTGIHAWGFNDVRHCNPAALNELLFQYPDVSFVLLHSGMPFIDEAIMLSKYFPNCFLNMTWMHIVDRVRSREAMRRYLEVLPTNKVVSFGGDYDFVESIYGHWKIAVENTAEVFWERIASGSMTEEHALEVIHRWFFENPMRIHQIPRNRLGDTMQQ